ncbi:ABC transporter substrate-binding protein [Salininema proteolyticum]|uniref:ABC transporter substrate-binding protein n=1 Tax=Salininema proteolyticum TaxID=1607685 RepID=A0ABV8TS92_9ACTN
MRKTTALAAAALVTLVAGCSDTSSEGSGSPEGLTGSGKGESCSIPDTVKIGASFSLSGAGEFAGVPQRNGLELAVQQLNEREGVDYETEVVDDETDSETSIATFEEFAAGDASVVFGPTFSSIGTWGLPVAQEAGLPAIGVSTTAVGIPEIGDFVFRSALPEEDTVAASVPAAHAELDFDRVAILHTYDDDFTVSTYEAMRAQLNNVDSEIVVDDSFPSVQDDYDEFLDEVAAERPDVILLSIFPETTEKIVGGLRSRGIDAPVLGGDAFNSPAMFEAMGENAENLIVGGSWSAELDTLGNQAFVDAYGEAYDSEPDQFAAQAYTAAMLVDAAVRSECDAGRTALRDSLGEITDEETIMGTVSLSPTGEFFAEPVVQIVKDGELTLLSD